MHFFVKFPFMYIIIITQNTGMFISGFKSSLYLIWQSLLSILSIVYIFNRKLEPRNHCYPDNIERGRKKGRANVWEEQAKARRERSSKRVWGWERERGWEEVKGRKCADKGKGTWEHTEHIVWWWKGGRREEEKGQGEEQRGKRGRTRQGEMKNTWERKWN